jgi:hypothetical protein
VAAIAKSTALYFVVFASTEILLLDLFGIFSITLKYEFKGLEFSSLVRAVTEWLVLGFSAGAIIVCVALLKINFVRFLLSDFGFSTVSWELAAISNESRFLRGLFNIFFFRSIKHFIERLSFLFLLDLFLSSRLFSGSWGYNLTDDNRFFNFDFFGIFFEFLIFSMWLFFDLILLDIFISLLFSFVNFMLLLPKLVHGTLDCIGCTLVRSNAEFVITQG